MHIKHLPCMCYSVPSSQAKRSLEEETFIYNKRVTFYDIFVLWIFILEFRPVVTWYILPQNFWLCSLFVHLDIQKNTSTLSFFYILVFTMHGNGFGRSPYIPKHSFLLTEIHIRMHVCTKKFFWRSFPYIYFTSN